MTFPLVTPFLNIIDYTWMIDTSYIRIYGWPFKNAMVWHKKGLNIKVEHIGWYLVLVVKGTHHGRRVVIEKLVQAGTRDCIPA
jgi:hypothetical protein